MTLEKLLSGKNIDGRIYLCDIESWLGIKLSYDKQEEIREKLEQLRDSEYAEI